MFRLFPLVMILEAFCLYHAYKNKADQKWFWAIIFFPLLGCGFYLYHHFYSRKNISNISEGVKEVINTNYQLDKLEKGVKFADTIENKTLLADKYTDKQRYAEAIELYESCLEGFNSDNPEIIRKLVKASHLNGDFEKAVSYAEQITEDRDFFKSEEKVFYAWSLFELGQEDNAEARFKEMDNTFSNYFQRLEYSRLLYKTGRTEEALHKLETLMEEFDQMESYERKLHREVQRTVRGFHGDIRRAG